MSFDPWRQALYNMGGVYRSCKAKRRFETEADARGEAQKHCSAATPAIWVYACSNCAGWHLSTKGGSSRLKVTAENLYARPR